jgi:predicted molibdopterin-dependent oxidoreductase YjgC
VNGEGRIQPVRKAVNPPGNALPDWEILCRIARKMGIPGFDYTCTADIRKEMALVIDEYRTMDETQREPHRLQISPPAIFSRVPGAIRPHKSNGSAPFLLTVSVVEHSHRGFPLSAWVEGSKSLLTEEMLEINPDDAKTIGISSGDSVAVTFNGTEKIWPAKIVREQPAGIVHASLWECSFIRPNPQPVTIRREHV